LHPAAGVCRRDLNRQRLGFDGGLGGRARISDGQLEREEIFLWAPSCGDEKENQQKENHINHRRYSQPDGRAAQTDCPAEYAFAFIGACEYLHA
jgi:hypothetical protein